MIFWNAGGFYMTKAELEKKIYFIVYESIRDAHVR